MDKNKEFTIEELKQMYEEATNESKTIGKMLRQKEKEEENRKAAQLALEKETRKNEVDEAFKHYYALKNAFIKDYGYYSTSVSESFKDINPIAREFLGKLLF